MVEAVSVIQEIANVPTGGMISRAPDDRRLKRVTDEGRHENPQRAKLATVHLMAAPDFGGARDRDGDRITGFRGALAGRLLIEVSSDGFRSGDRVYVDTGGNGQINGREAFNIDDRLARLAVPLNAEAMDIWYVPNGRDALRHGTAFTVTANTEFGNRAHKVRSAVPATATLRLQGMKDTVAKAYAIAPLGSGDTANVRITRETAAKSGCNVFLDCKDQDGANTFGDAGAIIGPGQTVRWDQMDIAEALGLARTGVLG